MGKPQVGAIRGAEKLETDWLVFVISHLFIALSNQLCDLVSIRNAYARADLGAFNSCSTISVASKQVADKWNLYFARIRFGIWRRLGTFLISMRGHFICDKTHKGKQKPLKRRSICKYDLTIVIFFVIFQHNVDNFFFWMSQNPFALCRKIPYFLVPRIMLDCSFCQTNRRHVITVQ